MTELERLNNLLKDPDFWSNKDEAKKILKQIEILKNKQEDLNINNNKIIFHIYAGAGGLDSEDFVKIINTMYFKYCQINNLSYKLIDQNINDKAGIKDIYFLIEGKSIYQKLKDESGIFRLIRKSPFNTKEARHTSFCTIETTPFLKKEKSIFKEENFKIEFSKSSGPGGQNVNKRETSVRIIDIESALSVSCSSERTQGANREKALDILKSKLYQRKKEENKKIEYNFNIKENANWGQQRRTFIFHPYKMIKDHKKNIECRDLESVLSGYLEKLL